LRAEIGGHGDSQYNSAFIREEPVDPRLAPVLHFRMRTSTCGQLAILFQETNGDEQAYDAIDLVGRDDAYHSLADLGGMRLNDGQWHEVSLDLAKLLQSQRGAGDPPRIKNLMIGSWQNPAEPILVEFQDFWLGPRRAN
jgi:hypothetical protein